MMDQDILYPSGHPVIQAPDGAGVSSYKVHFFDQHMDSLPLYEAFESSIRKEITDIRIKVQKTQISFYNRHFIGFLPFFKNEIEGFSAEEHTSNRYWWTGD